MTKLQQAIHNVGFTLNQVCPNLSNPVQVSAFSDWVMARHSELVAASTENTALLRSCHFGMKSTIPLLTYHLERIEVVDSETRTIKLLLEGTIKILERDIQKLEEALCTNKP